MPKASRRPRLEGSYRFAGFRPGRTVTGVFGDRYAQPYEKFAKMIERHWDGIVAHCAVENKGRARLR
jgi:hypothetical protein